MTRMISKVPVRSVFKTTILALVCTLRTNNHVESFAPVAKHPIEAFRTSCGSSSSSYYYNLPASTSTTKTTTALRYQNDVTVTTVDEESLTTTTVVDLPGVRTRKPNIVQKPTLPSRRPLRRKRQVFIENIDSLDELKYFLEEDERPVVIKFYAKWCKKCQRVGQHFDRLATELGDRIVFDEDQQQDAMIDGDVRFAAFEYTKETQSFITEDLHIHGIPTIQIYVGTNKLFDTLKTTTTASTKGSSSSSLSSSASSPIQQVRKELATISDMNHADVMARAEEADDGILTELIEESFFDAPDFLNEEW